MHLSRTPFPRILSSRKGACRMQVTSTHLSADIIRSRLLLLRKGGELNFGSHQFAIFLRDIYGNSVAYLRNVPSSALSSIPIFRLGDGVY